MLVILTAIVLSPLEVRYNAFFIRERYIGRKVAKKNGSLICFFQLPSTTPRTS